MKVRIDSPIAHAVANYTGHAVIEVDVVPDPVVPGVFALQAKLVTVGTLQFIVRFVPLQLVKADDLEECTFETWPPQRRA
jgi:hypothetical protein